MSKLLWNEISRKKVKRLNFKVWNWFCVSILSMNVSTTYFTQFEEWGDYKKHYFSVGGSKQIVGVSVFSVSVLQVLSFHSWDSGLKARTKTWTQTGAESSLRTEWWDKNITFPEQSCRMYSLLQLCRVKTMLINTEVTFREKVFSGLALGVLIINWLINNRLISTVSRNLVQV